MPTLNAGAILENCLASIARQTYPRERMEIILADARSRDNTREIAAKYGAKVLDDNGRNMEEGKRLALRHATGEYIVFVDADNEITHPDYLELAVRALAANPQTLGVESYYLPSSKMSSFCAYLTALLHISDPISWLMSTNPRLVALEGETERWVLPENSLSYPLGANGFVFRRSDLDEGAATGAALAGGGLLCDVFRPALAHRGRGDPGSRLALAMAPARVPGERFGQCLGCLDLPTASQ
jgi:glycosyltransferase involved in cell wall biosynthesis